MDAPGVTVTPLQTMGGERTNQVFFDNVRVPAANLVGEMNRGWYYLAVALDFERFNGFPLGSIRRSSTSSCAACARQPAAASRSPRSRGCRRRWQLSTRLDAAMTIKLQNVWMAEKGEIPNTEASMLKVLASDLAQEIARAASEILGPAALIKRGRPGALAGGRFEQALRGTPLQRFAGGTNEIMKNIIAQRGLGLPRD